MVGDDDEILGIGEPWDSNEMPEDVVANEDVTHWYKKESANSVFYTPFCASKRYIKYIPGGEEELASIVRDHPTWNTYGQFNNVFQWHDPKETTDEPSELPGGCYMHRNGDYSNPERLIPFKPRNDSHIKVGKIDKQVRKDIEAFLKSKSVYRDLGVIYKLGVLMYSSPGLGKTSTLRSIINDRFTGDEVIIWLEGANNFSTDFIKKIQQTLPNRLKVFVFEELTAQTSYTDRLERLLTFLDGELSVDYSISIATTNFPELLPRNVVDRPSRFDKVYEVKPPTDKEREALLKFFLKREPTPEEVTISKELTPAQLKEIAITHLVHETTLAEEIDRLKQRSKMVDKAFAAPKKETGFGF
jgi:hypothetical protein